MVEDISTENLVAGKLAVFDQNICLVENAIEAEVLCTSSTVCTLTPSSSLDYLTNYTLCLTNDISPLDSTRTFAGWSSAFTTQGTSTNPSVVISSDESTLTNESPFTVTFTFSEAVRDFALDDLSLTNATAATLNSGDNTTFTVQITPSSNGTVGVSLDADTVSSVTGGLGNTASNSFSITYDGTVPTIDSVSPSDASTDISESSTIVLVFDEIMDTDTITTNTTNTTCSGSIQVSSDSFSTCVQMNAAPVASNNDKTFTLTPSSSLTKSSTFKIRVTSSAMDLAGNAVSTFTTSIGFATEDYVIYMFGSNNNHTGNIGNRSAADSDCYDGWNNDNQSVKSKCSGDNVRALLCYTGGDDLVSMTSNYSVPSTAEIRGPNETVISTDWSGLFDNSIDARPYDDAAAAPSQSFYWTGCQNDGTVDTNNCSDWTGTGSGERGDNGLSTGVWLDADDPGTCGVTNTFHACICW